MLQPQPSFQSYLELSASLGFTPVRIGLSTQYVYRDDVSRLLLLLNPCASRQESDHCRSSASLLSLHRRVRSIRNFNLYHSRASVWQTRNHGPRTLCNSTSHSTLLWFLSNSWQRPKISLPLSPLSINVPQPPHSTPLFSFPL